MKFKKIRRRGQAMVLWALLTPLLILFVGVGMDLGWYYLNVSRLQHAADAAALAGAQALVKSDAAFQNYYIVALASNQVPKDFHNYEDVYDKTFENNVPGVLKYYSKIDTTKNIEDDSLRKTLRDGRVLAEDYARKNLSDADAVNATSEERKKLSATDGWANEKADSAVKGTVELKYKLDDGKDDVYGPLYYIVTLSEKVRHFFLPGWFDDMDAPVKAVVLLLPHNEGLVTPIEQLKREKVINNWESTNQFKDPDTGLSVSGGKWNHYKSGTNSNDTGISYSTGNAYRTESVRVKTSNNRNESDGQATAANGNKFYPANQVDSINIDFQAEIRVNSPKFTTDWDLGSGLSSDLSIFKSYNHVDKNNSWGVDNGDDKRILFNVEFNEPFPTRYPNREADILWTRIESDPLKNPYTGAGVNVFNSVRQITLNFNTDNTTKAADGNYTYRPYFIFYDGPENIDYRTDSNGVLVRHSQPIVININADLNAILYMPESPVIINGNNHAWHGFIIARCFLKPVTEEEMINNNIVRLYDGFNKSYTFKGDYTKGLDGKGQYVYYHDDDHLTTKEQIDTKHKDGTITVDGTTGNIVVKELVQAPKRLLLEYTKADSEEYEVMENGKHNENKTFAAYVNATCKEKFKAFHELDDSQIVAVTFPDENYNETTATYYVKADVLKDNYQDGYVKVKVGDTDKYVDQKNLPYVKVRTDKEYFYVSVYDLKLTTSGGKGVRMIDNSYTDAELDASYKKSGDISSTAGDVHINLDDAIYNKYGDSWAIDRTWYEKQRGNWKKDQFDFVNKNGVNGFILKSEMPKEPQIVAKYHKITLLDDKGEVLKDTDGNPVVKYVPDDDNKKIQYYTQVQNNANNLNNYIIVDKYGNMLTKPLTAPQIFKVKDDLKISDEEPADTDEDDGINDKAENDSVESDIASSDYLKTYTREPKVPTEDPNIPVNQRDRREKPDDPGTITDEGKYRGKTHDNLKKRDYRIPVFERVYEAKNAFGLSKENSYYSYFQIPELWRVNYIYLDVNENKNPPTVYRYDVPDGKDYWKVEDMFFTKVRAKWID